MKKEKTITKEANATTKNLAGVVFFKAILYPVLLLSMMLVPRTMGPTIYGEYAVLISIIVIVTTLVDFGSGAIFGRFVPEFESRGEIENIRKLTTNIFAFKVIIELIVSIILFSVLYFLYRDKYPVIYFFLLIAILVVHDWTTIPLALLFGLNKLVKYALRDPIRRVLSLTFILILFHFFGLIGAIISNLLVEISLALVVFYWTKGYFLFKYFKPDLSFLKPYLRFEALYYLATVLLITQQRLGNPLIEQLAGDTKEVALFDLPNSIFVIVLTFTSLPVESLVPIFSKLLLMGKEGKLINWSKLITKYLGILCSITIGSYILAAPDLIPILIGPQFKEFFPNGVGLLFGMFPMIFAQMAVVYSVVYKQIRKYLTALIFSFTTFITASFLLIPKYASFGCAVAVLISCITLFLVMFFFFKDKILPCIKEALKVMALGLVFVPFLFIKGDIVISLFVTGGFLAVYFLILFYSGSLKLAEIKEIIQAVRHKSDE